jgi:ankyrin repeat protein
LHWACKRCPVEIVEAILDKGVNIDELSTKSNWTPWMNAADDKKWDVVKFLLVRGANSLLVESQNMLNVLHIAASRGAPHDIIKDLIDHGADPLAITVQGKTPGDIASECGHPTTTAASIQLYVTPVKSANLLV